MTFCKSYGIAKAFTFKLRAQNSFEELFVSCKWLVPEDFILLLYKLTRQNIFTLNVILVHKITVNITKKCRMLFITGTILSCS